MKSEVIIIIIIIIKDGLRKNDKIYIEVVGVN
jgi:hypothetical protein